MLYNPLKESIRRTIQVPLYYTGLKNSALIGEKGKAMQSVRMNEKNEIQLSFTIAPESYTWFVIE